MAFGKSVKCNVLQTSRIIHNLSNDVFISNNIINKGKVMDGFGIRRGGLFPLVHDID